MYTAGNYKFCCQHVLTAVVTYVGHSALKNGGFMMVERITVKVERNMYMISYCQLLVYHN